jgi:hypothetical protein
LPPNGPEAPEGDAKLGQWRKQFRTKEHLTCALKQLSTSQLMFLDAVCESWTSSLDWHGTALTTRVG